MAANVDSLTWNLIPKSILEVLQPYQVKGEDTLTFGDQRKWIDHKQQVTQSLTQSEEVDTSNAPRIIYRNPETVRTYLACHPEVDNFLEITWPAVVRYFGGPVDIILEVMFYPEEEAAELVGWIQFTGDIEDGLEKLEQFEDKWLEQQLVMVGSKFNFNIEFVR